MKYLKAIFNLTAGGSKEAGDAVMLQAAKDVLCGMLGDADLNLLKKKATQ